VTSHGTTTRRPTTKPAASRRKASSATTGASNILAFVFVQDLDGLHDYLADRIGGLPGVLQTDTSPMGKQVEHAGRTM
jgi:hypothetical protein